MPPSGLAVTLPVTSACADSALHAAKRGAVTSAGVTGVAKASTGLNSPDEPRSAAMTTAIWVPSVAVDPAAVGASAVAGKPGTAIGSGDAVPLLMSTRMTAAAGAATARATSRNRVRMRASLRGIGGGGHQKLLGSKLISTCAHWSY